MGADLPSPIVTFLIGFAGVAIVALSGCSYFVINHPTDGSVESSPTTIGVIGNPIISPIRVQVTDRNPNPNLSAPTIWKDVDVFPETDIESTGQVTVSTVPGPHQVTIVPGPHLVTASAIVGCWYCTGGQWSGSDTKKFCVTSPNPAATTVTMFSVVDDKSWANFPSSDISLRTRLRDEFYAVEVCRFAKFYQRSDWGNRVE